MMTLAQIILSIAVMFGSSFSTLDINRSKGCTAPLLLPDKPFLVIWNHPTSSCKAKGIDLNFEEWGIVDNSKDAFIGEQIALFYDLGQYPRFSDSRIVNGGIPQLGNLTYHLQKVDTDLNSIIPSASFSGLGVIDFESWRPLYYLNFDSLRIYQQKSLELAKQKFPGYNSTQLLHEAVEEFDEAARLFIETTLQKVSDLRQSGRWGYYGYPRCWDTYCNSSTVGVNDQMSWIYNLSSGLYPSIYFSAGRPENVTANYVRNIILETLRVKSKWSPQDAAILPYAYIQNGPYSFFTETYLSYSIQEPANMGSSGVVLWGSSRNIQDKNECIALQEYLNNTLGPFALQVTNFFANCSQQLCQVMVDV
uniref:Hyaluronidase n=1 Tax=Arion vulgaris TaxID=1028688 RepID=A0A0B7A2C8_9EUPU